MCRFKARLEFWRWMGTSRAAFLRFSYNLSAKVRKVEDERMGVPSAIFAIVAYGCRVFRLHRSLPLEIVVSIAWYTRLTHLHHTFSYMHIPPTLELQKRHKFVADENPNQGSSSSCCCFWGFTKFHPQFSLSAQKSHYEHLKLKPFRPPRGRSFLEYPMRYNSFRTTYLNVDECLLAT